MKMRKYLPKSTNLLLDIKRYVIYNLASTFLGRNAVKKYIYSEFIRYDKSFAPDKKDFYGTNSPLDQKGTKEFFRKYLEARKKEYGEDCLERKAVSKEQLESSFSVIKKEPKPIFSASKRKHSSGYKNWQLYTDRASIDGNTVILSDNYSLPTAAAKCELTEKPTGLSLWVYFDEEYRRGIPGGSLITTPGKIIDLRCGITDSVRLFFAEDGRLEVRVNKSGDAYHFASTELGEYPFGERFRLEFEFFDDSFTLYGLGSSVHLPYLLGARPDTLFLSGGLQPTSLWSVEVESVFVGSEELNIFERSDESVEEIKLGDITLPFAIGTEKDKDCELILRRRICCEKDLSYALRLESLDPSGDVFVGGKLAYHTDSFEPFTLSLDGLVTEGENEIEIRVMPRAPELNYIWHRHRDPYNGWFSLSADLLCSAEQAKEIPIVTALGSGAPERFKVEWDTGLSGDVEYKAYIKKSYPAESDFTEIKSGKLEKCKVCFTKECNYSFWTPDEPNLYEIKLELYRGEKMVCSDIVETGFRTIIQRDGAILLNGRKTVLRGALNMQFLPPYDEIPINHVCPSDIQILEQLLALKNLGGNCMRLHQLGHGSSDKRFASLADRLGVMLIWTTRAIDSAEQILWNRTDEEPWRLAELYKRQMRPFLNYPSIIMWEGSNELHSGLKDLDRLYDSFVTAVREVDCSRLICPVSHLYYGGGLYGGPDATTDYYNNDGTRAADGEEVRSSFGWLDESVVRSSHTYSLLLGYGAPWQAMVKQDWKWQRELFEAKDKAYIISEFAIIGRQNPHTAGAREFINKDSYELGNESAALGYTFTDEEWALGQAYQALCADMAIRQLRRFDADGMIWCSLWSGANNGSYLKPPIDFMGYRKLAFYRMREGFAECMAANEEPDVLFCDGYSIKPLCTGLTAGREYSLTVEVRDADGDLTAVKNYSDFRAETDILTLTDFSPAFPADGYYTVKYTLTEK